MEDVIFRCLTCNTLFCPTHYDKYPSYSFDKSSHSFQEKENDDLDEFTKAHKGHDIVELKMLEGSFCSYHAYWDPIREDYIKATDGLQTFTVRRWRRDINEPLKYEIIDSDIIIGKPKLEIQSRDIRRQMIADSKVYGFSKIIIELIVNLYADFVSQINVDDVLECGFSVDDPMVSYARLTDEAKKRFLNYCRDWLGSDQRLMLERFIDDNSEYDDVMNIKINRSFWLKPSNERVRMAKPYL